VSITCDLDAFSGVGGDMLVGSPAYAVASLDAGASVSFEKVKRCGIGATEHYRRLLAAQAGRRHSLPLPVSPLHRPPI
jgi:hypothetical protein